MTQFKYQVIQFRPGLSYTSVCYDYLSLRRGPTLCEVLKCSPEPTLASQQRANKEKENGKKNKRWERGQPLFLDQEKDFKYHARNVGFMENNRLDN